VVARLGGDEFAVILPETPPDGATIAMEKAHDRLTRELSHADVWFSVGVITYDGGPATLPALLDAADRVMYSVKRDGRGRVKSNHWAGTAAPTPHQPA
jgi:diguanylate cyclase (GGDEF)-like protein